MMQTTTTLLALGGCFGTARSVVWEDVQAPVPDGDYTSVFAFPKKRECAATLISTTPTRSHAVTAAHCFSPGTEGVKVPFDVTFTSRLGVKHTSTVTKVLLNKCFHMEEDGPNGADLALLIIEPPVDPEIAVPTSMVSDDADAVGKEFSFVGWGDHGKAGSRKPPECTATEGGCSQLNLGRNTITAFKGNVLEYTLDAKDDSDNGDATLSPSSSASSQGSDNASSSASSEDSDNASAGNNGNGDATSSPSSLASSEDNDEDSSGDSGNGDAMSAPTSV